MKLKVKKLHQNAKLPVYASAGAGAFDLHAMTVADCYHVESKLEHGSPLVCGTGLSFEVPAGHVMLIFSRSGHGFVNDVRLGNCVGVIDSDYRGEVKVKLTKDHNWRDETKVKPAIAIKPGDRIAQAMIVPIPTIEFEEVTDLGETDRGSGGFGSTGS